MEGIDGGTSIGRDCRSHSDCGYPLKLLKCKKKEGEDEEGKDIYVDIEDDEEGKCVDVSGYVPPPEGLSLDFKIPEAEAEADADAEEEREEEAVKEDWQLHRAAARQRAYYARLDRMSKQPEPKPGPGQAAARDTCFSRGLKCLGIGDLGSLKPNKSKKKTRKTKRRTNKKLKKSKKNKRRKRIGKKSKRRNR